MTTEQVHQPHEDRFGLRFVLALIALLEAFEAILDLPLIVGRPNLLFGPWAEQPKTALEAFLAMAHVVTHPLLAIGALAFCMAGRVREALIALGAISVLTWLGFMPLYFRKGLPLDGPWEIQWTVMQLLLFPLLAGTAIALAALKVRYGLATALVAIPTISNTFWMVWFVVAVINANM